jgi:endonuclease/exonuclease/phosphatase family metal-dependent hydrolase
MPRNVTPRRLVAVAALGVLAIGAQSAAAATSGRSVPSTRPARSAVTHLQSVNVMTYNILQLLNDGKHEGNGVIAPWSKRGPKQAALVRGAHPDVIAIEEGAAYVGHSRERQVSSLRNYIGGSYRLAKTEIPPTQPHYFRTGVYILYNSATERPVGKGAHFGLGLNRYAAYQEFASRTTNAKFLFVAAHLLVGRGRSDDLARESETKKILSHAGGIAARRGIPAIYAGDFNSANPKGDKKFTLNGAGIAMREAHAKDALVVAPRRTNGKYDSANGYFRKPPRSGDDIDHIYAPPGVRVASAGIVIHLRHGKFVGVIPSDHNPLVAELRYPY